MLMTNLGIMRGMAIENNVAGKNINVLFVVGTELSKTMMLLTTMLEVQEKYPSGQYWCKHSRNMILMKKGCDETYTRK